MAVRARDRDAGDRKGAGASRRHGGIATLAVLVLALAAPSTAAGAGSGDIVGLGNLLPSGVNASGAVSGDTFVGEVGHAARWSGGVLTRLPERAGTELSDALAIGDGGRVVGLEQENAPHTGVHALFWDGFAAPIEVPPFVPQADDFSIANDVDAAGDVVGSLYNAGGTGAISVGFLRTAAGVVTRLTGGVGPGEASSLVAITQDGSQVLGRVTTASGPSFRIWSTGALDAPGTPIDLTPVTGDFQSLGASTFTVQDGFQNAFANDGSVLGSKGAPASRTWWIRYPDGTEFEIEGLTRPLALNRSHRVVGYVTDPLTGAHGAVWDPLTAKVTDLNDLLQAGSGWFLSEALAINDAGQIAGVGSFDGAPQGYLFDPPRGARTLRGVARLGADGTHPRSPAKPFKGLVVRVTGRTDAGKAVNVATTTATNGTYAIVLETGKYTLTVPTTACIGGTTGCVQTKALTVADVDLTVDLVVRAAELVVAVTPSPSHVELEKVPASKKAKGGKKVVVHVKVRNAGTVAATDVVLDPRLAISYADGDAAVPVVPIVQGDPPPLKLRRLGTLKPGGISRVVDYKVTAKGDGTYELEALATGTQAGGGNLRATGAGRLEVATPLLSFTAAFYRQKALQPLRAAGKAAPVIGPSLATRRHTVRAGNAYTLLLTYKNLSYRTTLEVLPHIPAVEGNAQGGFSQPVGSPIPGTDTLDVCTVPTALELDPRETRKVEAIFYTTASDPTVRASGAQAGTRSVVEYRKPEVWTAGKGDALGARVKPREILTTAASLHIETSVLDPSERPPNARYDKAVDGWIWFSIGVAGAFKDAAVGIVQGVQEIPALIARTPEAVSALRIAQVEYEAELWHAVKDVPELRALVLSRVTGPIVKSIYINARLSGKAKELAEKVPGAVEAHFTRLENAWQAGDWEQAAYEYGHGAGTAGLTVLAIPRVSSCVMVRLAPLVQRFSLFNSARYARFSQWLAETYPSVIDAFESFAITREIPIGVRLDEVALRRIYGISQEEAAYLADFARRHRVLISMRGRAPQSLHWLKDGAVLKPEQIKIKTVNFFDAKWLGYREDDIGIIVLRKPITEQQLKVRLRAARLTADDAEWKEAVERLKARTAEWTAKGAGDGTGGQVADLKLADARKEMKLRWNLEENAVDPTVHPNVYNDYGFRLREYPAGSGNLRAEFLVKGEYRVVTGDIDFLSIVHASGRPLTAAERIELYKEMIKSPIGMLHPAADTWVYHGEFNFDKKIGEFVRGGVVPQFGPDGVARAVVYVKELSYFGSPRNYRIVWRGGWKG